ncbi:MAG: LysR family transcriptional regulator [Thauera sp.]|jgi:DNA-binding transcriptional LysR family regulator
MARVDDLDLNSLLIFAAVAEAGGFTAAADRLGTSKARLSLVIARLERRLGTTLFSRTTRRVTLTEAGEALQARCVPLLREAHAVLAELAAGDGAELAGTLRLTASVDLATHALAGVVAAFSAHHPRLQIELRTSDRVVDLVQEGLDLGLRMGWLRDSTLRATRLGAFEQYVVSSPAYLARHPQPTAPEDLAHHAWVALTLLPTPLTWTFVHAGDTRSVRMNAVLRTDSAATLRALLRHGAGVSVLDQLNAEAAIANGELVRLLPAWKLPLGGIYAVHPPGRHVPAKVRAFIDFCRGMFPSTA